MNTEGIEKQAELA